MPRPPAPPVIASDETSACVTGKAWWQWVFASTSAVYHAIHPTRGRKVPVEFLAGAPATSSANAICGRR